jgi:hypothetical protein
MIAENSTLFVSELIITSLIFIFQSYLSKKTIRVLRKYVPEKVLRSVLRFYLKVSGSSKAKEQ